MKSESSGAAEIALHFELGGDPDRAIDYLVAAAEGVVRRFADREAISYLDHALVLLDSQPPSPDRDGRECDLRRRLATALVLTVGYTAPEQLANAERLIELGASSGDVEAELVGLSYKQDTHLASGDLDGAHRWAERTSRVATRATNPILKGHAFETLGHVLGLRGENVGSAASCERAFELLRDVPPREVSAVAAYDICVTASAFQGWAEWMLGLPEKASRLTKAGLERASMEGTTPVGIAMALSFALAVGYFRRDRDSVRNTGRELEACLEKYGVAWPYPLPAAAVGWLDLTEGRIAEGVERMRASGNAAREVGANHCISILYATIAEAELTRGCPAAGFEALDEAVHFVETDGERFWEAETHRLRGELLRLDGRDGEAEGWYDRSLEVARSQDALSLELRTSTSLARLWGDTERGDAARELLEGVLARFTEGFEEIDHREAKELLESL
jgi:adenylate cyclase